MRNETATLISADPRTLGSDLDVDAAAGATQLVVDDAVDFDQNGGHLQINDAILAYSTFDDDTATITLTDPLPAAAAAGDRVDVFDIGTDKVAVEWTAQVEVDGDEFNGESLTADIDQGLLPYLSEGLQPSDQRVIIQWDDDIDSLTVIDLANRHAESGSTQFCDTDTFKVTTPGDQVIQLSHEPLDGSLHLTWHPDGLAGASWPSSKWTLDGKTLTVPDPEGLIEAGDLLDPQYAYSSGVAAASTSIAVAYEAAGWKYLPVDSTDTTDRSAPAFDDSAWATGQAGFGDPQGAQSLGNVNTYVPHAQGVWLRRHIAGGGRYVMKLRLDGSAEAYWNGAKVGNWATFAETDQITIPSNLVNGDNVLAIFHHDYDQPNPVNMVDAQVTVTVVG